MFWATRCLYGLALGAWVFVGCGNSSSAPESPGSADDERSVGDEATTDEPRAADEGPPDTATDPAPESEPTGDAVSSSGLPIAGHGEVCISGPMSGDRGVVAECAAGLRCCYACGIAGCDSVCHTPEECALDMTRP